MNARKNSLEFFGRRARVASGVDHRHHPHHNRRGSRTRTLSGAHEPPLARDSFDIAGEHIYGGSGEGGAGGSGDGGDTAVFSGSNIIMTGGSS